MSRFGMSCSLLLQIFRKKSVEQLLLQMQERIKHSVTAFLKRDFYSLTFLYRNASLHMWRAQKSSTKWKLTMRDEMLGGWTRPLIARLSAAILLKAITLHHSYIRLKS